MTEGVRTKKKKLFLQGLKDNLGIIESALRAAGVSRGTYDKWRRDDEEFNRSCDEVMEAQCDFVEGKLLQKINDGDISAIIFYLKTKGKKRGWTEKAMKEEKPTAQQLPQITGNAVDRRNEFYNRVTVKKEYLISRLKEQGKYTDELEVSVTLTAETYVQFEMLQDQMLSDDYQSVTVQISREGNERRQLNPQEAQLMALRRQLMKQLTAIGMTTDSKERKQDGDSFKDFLDEIKS